MSNIKENDQIYKHLKISSAKGRSLSVLKLYWFLRNLNIPLFDYIDIAYLGDRPITFVFKNGGESGNTVTTIHIGYFNNLISYVLQDPDLSQSVNQNPLLIQVPAAAIAVAGVVPSAIGQQINSFTWSNANNSNPPANSYRLYSSTDPFPPVQGGMRLSTTTSSGYNKNKLLLLVSGTPITVIVKGVTSTGSIVQSASLEDAGTATERVWLRASLTPAVSATQLGDGPLVIRSAVF